LRSPDIVQQMTLNVLFAGIAVARFDRAVDWYARFFDRAADVVAHETEVMWRVADNGWLYVLEDAERAGRSLVTIAVTDLDAVVRELAERDISAGPIENVGDAARKAKLLDPDDNLVALIQVA
jgi:predicted enzyme related to lactoylglutathione lyase